MMREKILATASEVYFAHMKACTQSNIVSDFEDTIAQILFHTSYSL